jgi:predicted nuclease of predicted toxin-antitoxin system
VRILLDAHVSARVIAADLRRSGHDVLALSEDRALQGIDDLQVLALASAERRILVTFNIRDFAPLLREWAEARRPHYGCILVYGLDHSRYRAVLEGLRRLFEERPGSDDWRDLSLVLPYDRGRSSTRR